MIRTGVDSGTVPKTALLDMYSRHGSLDDSLKVFDEMLHRDVVAWNALLSCFLRCGQPHEAIGVLREMGRENVELSEFTLCSVLKSCASLKALELGRWCYSRQVHGLVVSLGRDLVVLSTALIDFYCSVGCVNHALNVFYSLNGWKDDMMHNSLVSGCIRNGRYGEAFKVMSLVKPNVVAFTSVLVSCSEKLDLVTGKQVHCVAVRRGFTFDTQLCNVLLDMYAKCGKISLARSVFDGIRRKDLVIILGWWRKEKKCFNMMREKYGIDPEPEHYACFIDVLGRADNIEEVWSAYQNMIKQGTKPTAGVWIAVLNACSLSQDFERGEFAAKHLLLLDPDKASNIVLVSNFYAAIGRWDCVDELRSIMRTKGLVKEAGNSWIGEGFNGHARSLST
ncbi:pentatricopeptide repeat-containing protein At5g66500, mitochondrial [Lathyrus oleraceus]|uniref:pentatricopeptide repeat-containing protein At5g66500, mitochondrial n=1 Tax=Pisum sativum TaxID=3888 RepID=UPI0021D2B000|nr:pentatricopeptide repeat-containing protein At5g66500, mitochondrial-like [Pisum sativum]